MRRLLAALLGLLVTASARADTIEGAAGAGNDRGAVLAFVRLIDLGVTYDENNFGTHDYQAEGRVARFDARGNLVAGDGVLVGRTAPTDGYPHALAWGNDGFLVSVERQGFLLDGTGAASLAPAELAMNFESPGWGVTTFETGAIVANILGTRASGLGVSAQRYDHSGGATGEPIPIAGYVGEDRSDFLIFPYPPLVAAGSSAALVAWVDAEGLHATRLSLDGQILDAAPRLLVDEADLDLDVRRFGPMTAVPENNWALALKTTSGSRLIFVASDGTTRTESVDHEVSFLLGMRSGYGEVWQEDEAVVARLRDSAGAPRPGLERIEVSGGGDFSQVVLDGNGLLFVFTDYKSLHATYLGADGSFGPTDQLVAGEGGCSLAAVGGGSTQSAFALIVLLLLLRRAASSRGTVASS